MAGWVGVFPGDDEVLSLCRLHEATLLRSGEALHEKKQIVLQRYARGMFLKRFLLAVLLPILAMPALASTHKEMYDVPCSTLWAALKDALRNSGKYRIVSLDNSEMISSFDIGNDQRVNSAALNSKDNGNSCELQIQTVPNGMLSNDAGNLKKRVDESLARLKAAPPANPTTRPEESKTPDSASNGSLTIESAPAGADIEVDGEFVGNTPSTVTVTLGSHQITVKKKGFTDWSRKLNVTGGSIHLNAELEKTPAQ